MATELDFIGLNMYSRAIVAARPGGRRRPASRRVPGTGPRTTMDWEVWPAALHRLVHADRPRLRQPPIYITENGCAEPTGPARMAASTMRDRVDYLAGHIGQLARAIDDGCDVRGYFAWSLLDNFEWAVGYTQRFGVVWVDFDDGLRRLVKDSGWWLRDLVAGPARSSTTRRWSDGFARSRQPARQAGRACSTNRPIRRSASSSRSYEVA